MLCMMLEGLRVRGNYIPFKTPSRKESERERGNDTKRRNCQFHSIRGWTLRGVEGRQRERVRGKRRKMRRSGRTG